MNGYRCLSIFCADDKLGSIDLLVVVSGVGRRTTISSFGRVRFVPSEDLVSILQCIESACRTGPIDQLDEEEVSIAAVFARGEQVYQVDATSLPRLDHATLLRYEEIFYAMLLENCIEDVLGLLEAGDVGSAIFQCPMLLDRLCTIVSFRQSPKFEDFSRRPIWGEDVIGLRQAVAEIVRSSHDEDAMTRRLIGDFLWQCNTIQLNCVLTQLFQTE